jgi:hypothetical protein
MASLEPNVTVREAEFMEYRTLGKIAIDKEARNVRKECRETE